MKTGYAEWQKADHIFSYQVDGEMVRFKNKDIDMLVTPDHKMLGRFRFGRYVPKKEPYSGRYGHLQLIQADEIEEWCSRHRGGDYSFQVPRCAKWVGEFPEGYHKNTDTVIVDTKNGKRAVLLRDLVAFWGIYIAEGSFSGSLSGINLSYDSDAPRYVQAQTSERKRKTAENFRVEISQLKITSRVEILDLLSRLPWEFKECKSGFRVCDQDLWKLVSEYGNSYTKKVPLWIKDLPPDYLKIFLHWAIKGDGWVIGDGHRLYSTVSRELANDMQEIFQRSGTSASLHIRQPQRYKKQSMKGSTRSAPVYILYEKTSEFLNIRHQFISREQYCGAVYCADIPNKTVYIRRNGKATWAGRSEFPPSRRAINIIKFAIEPLKWNVGPFMYVGDKDHKLTDQEKVQREIAMNCLSIPNKDDSWRVFISQVLEDLIVGGYGTIELSKTYNRARPYFLFPVDGASIRINPDWDQDRSSPRYVQSYNYSGVQISGTQWIELYDDEIIYMRLNPRTNTPFGLGYLETAFLAVNAWLGAFQFSERRASNATPSYGIFLGSDSDDTFAREFRQYWIDQIEGYGNIPIWAGGEGVDVLNFRNGGEDELFLLWQEMLVRVIAMSFGLTPLSLGLERDINRSTAGSLQIQEWGNIKPIISLVEDYITQRFIWRALGYRGMEFKFTVSDADDERQAKVIKLRWDSDSMTVNEMRKIYDLDPLEEPWGGMTKTRYGAYAKAMAKPEALPY